MLRSFFQWLRSRFQWPRSYLEAEWGHFFSGRHHFTVAEITFSAAKITFSRQVNFFSGRDNFLSDWDHDILVDIYRPRPRSNAEIRYQISVVYITFLVKKITFQTWRYNFLTNLTDQTYFLRGCGHNSEAGITFKWSRFFFSSCVHFFNGRHPFLVDDISFLVAEITFSLVNITFSVALITFSLYHPYNFFSLSHDEISQSTPILSCF